jgi:uncharacterized protein involved in exopolysaccharide biosynthesis
MPNLPNLREDREFSLGVFSPDLQETPVGKHRGRRLLVFLCVCLPLLVLGLAYTVMQPAEYQATARLEITPASATPTPVDDTPGAKTGTETGGSAARGPRSFLTEVQVLTSRPLIEEVVERLSRSGDLHPDIRSDAVDGVRQMLSTDTVEGTEVVLLRAEGPQRQFLARLVNTLTSVYQEHVATAYEKSTGSGADQLRESVRALDQKMAAKRQEVDAFRSSNDIVSTERDENQLLSAAKASPPTSMRPRAIWLRPRGSCARYGTPLRLAKGSSPPGTTQPSQIWRGAPRNCARSCMISSNGSHHSIWIWTRP